MGRERFSMSRSSLRGSGVAERDLKPAKFWPSRPLKYTGHTAKLRWVCWAVADHRGLIACKGLIIDRGAP